LAFYLEPGEEILWSDLMHRNYDARGGAVLQTRDIQA